MTSPAGQGESYGRSTANRVSPAAAAYCALCGGPADPRIRRGHEAFCSEQHAEEFAGEVAALRAAGGREA